MFRVLRCTVHGAGLEAGHSHDEVSSGFLMVPGFCDSPRTRTQFCRKRVPISWNWFLGRGSFCKKSSFMQSSCQ